MSDLKKLKNDFINKINEISSLENINQTKSELFGSVVHIHTTSKLPFTNSMQFFFPSTTKRPSSCRLDLRWSELKSLKSFLLSGILLFLLSSWK